VKDGRHLVNGHRRVQPEHVVGAAADEMDAPALARRKHAGRRAFVDQTYNLGAGGEQRAGDGAAQEPGAAGHQRPAAGPGECGVAHAARLRARGVRIAAAYRQRRPHVKGKRRATS
jgi:hypothetical protein